jgi:hypothetical protein
MKKIFFILVFLIFVSVLVNAQNETSQWQKYRHEVFVGLGSTNFMGDLGGSDVVGSTPIRDFDFKASRFMIHGGYFYRVHKRWAIGAALAYGMVYGGDKYTKEEFRSKRNLHFRSSIIELSPMVRFSILTENYGHLYKLGQKGRPSIRPDLYIFTGVSGFWFNPKAQYNGDIEEHKGDWFALQPLGTEGQGIIETRDPYKRVAIAIPVGLGISVPVNNQLSVGAEFGFRYTFTDYIDDVSTSYVSTDIFDDPIAAWFSNPPTEDGEVWNGSGAGQQRGSSKNNDVYMFLSITVKYKFPTKGLQTPKF